MTSITTVDIYISAAVVLRICFELFQELDLLSDHSSSLLASTYHGGLLHSYSSPAIACQVFIRRHGLFSASPES